MRLCSSNYPESLLKKLSAVKSFQWKESTVQDHDCRLYWLLIMYRNSYLLQHRFAKSWKIFLQYCILLQASDLDDFKLFEWFCCCYNNFYTDNREINNCSSRFNDLNVSRASAFLPFCHCAYDITLLGTR